LFVCLFVCLFVYVWLEQLDVLDWSTGFIVGEYCVFPCCDSLRSMVNVHVSGYTSDDAGAVDGAHHFVRSKVGAIRSGLVAHTDDSEVRIP
jgi:hypothetical protein